jgi:hypothetical protein
MWHSIGPLTSRFQQVKMARVRIFLNQRSHRVQVACAIGDISKSEKKLLLLTAP